MSWIYLYKLQTNIRELGRLLLKVLTKIFNGTVNWFSIFCIHSVSDDPSGNKNRNINLVQSEYFPLVIVYTGDIKFYSFVSDELSSHYSTILAGKYSKVLSLLIERRIGLVVCDTDRAEKGLELCNYIKSDRKHCHIPVVLIISHGDMKFRINGLRKGADACIDKSFTTGLIFAQIKNIFSNRETTFRNFINSPLTSYRSGSVSDKDFGFMQRFHSVIIDNLQDQDLTVDGVANVMGMSVCTLYRKVHALTSHGTNKYIRLYRLKKATEMLETGKYMISEVAYLTGFSSPSYFTSCFHDQFGITPSQFINHPNDKTG